MNENIEERKQRVKRSIEQKMASLMAKIDDSSLVANAQQLHDTEKDIAAITDEIAGCVIETIVARSIQEQNLIAEGKALAKQAPVRMKNRGLRPVEIKPHRGAPFIIETNYYAKAGQSEKKASKKKGSTQS